MAHYRITPLEKKSIEVFFELYRDDPETGMPQWVNIRETYRWGQAFISEDMECNLPTENDTQAYCRMEAGENESCEFDDSIAVSFEFDESINESEQEDIKKEYYDGGAGWVYDGVHEWGIEDDYVIVYGPFKIELCDEDGNIIKEVTLKKSGE